MASVCALASTPVVRTLHDDVRLDLEGLASVAEALLRLNATARGVSGDLGRFLCDPPDQEPAKVLEHNDLLPTLKRLRQERDMMIEGQVKGLSFVLMGLAVPTEVLAITSSKGAAIDIQFRTEGVLKDTVYLACSLTTLTGQHGDLMHALAPAIVAFLATHKIDDAHLIDRMGDLKPTGKRLMIPPSLLAAAGHDNIRDSLLAARTAFIDGGYHVAPLAHIKLAHVGTMEDWLASRARIEVELANTAKALDAQIVAVRRRMLTALEEGMSEIEQLVKRHKRALCLCMDASVSPAAN